MILWHKQTKKQIKKKLRKIRMTSAEVHALPFGRLGRRPTCDIRRHQSLGSDDLHLHHADIFQVVEGPPNALKHHRHGGQRVRGGRKLAPERKSGQ